MKKRSIIYLLSCVLPCLNTVAQETIEFVGDFPSSSAVHIASIGARPQAERLNSEKYGRFNVQFENFSDEEVYAFKMALKLWEETLVMTKDISVKATFNGPVSTAYTVNVLVDDNNGLYYPYSLYKQKWSSNRPNTDIDIIINFNRDKSKWDFNTDITSPIQNNKNDFITTAIRAIGKGLGFGAPLGGINTAVRPQFSPYIFGGKVRNSNGDIFTSYTIPSDALNNFVINDAFWSRNNYWEYKLYTPSIYNKYYTLNYFDLGSESDIEKAIMAPNFIGRIRHIGSRVVDIMEDIGWASSGFSVKCDDINNNGIISNNPSLSYQFYCNPNSNISSYNWSFDIAQKNGSYRTIATSTNSQFTMQVPSAYLETDERTSTGLIKGRVRIEANTTSGGNKIANYALSITCVPERPHIATLDTIAPQEYMRDLLIGFASFGASYYEVEFEDLDFGGIANQIVYQKDYNTKLLEGFYVGGNYLITVKARNEFGASTADSLYLYNAFVESPTLDNGANIKKIRERSIIGYLDNCEVDVFNSTEQYKYANWGIDLFFEENGKIEKINYISNQKTENNLPYKFNFKDLLSTFGLPEFPNEISKDAYYFWESNDSGYTLANITFDGITNDNRSIKNSINVLLNLAPSKPEFEIINFKYYPDPNSDWESIDLRFRGVQPISTPPIFNRIYRWWLDGVGGVNSTINPDDIITNNDETITTIHSLRSYNGFGISDWTNFDPMEYYNTGSNEMNKVDEIGISIYPNPATDQIMIKTNKSLESCKAIIYNMTGNEMMRLCPNDGIIDISDLSNGNYILRIVLANETQVLRFIKITN